MNVRSLLAAAACVAAMPAQALLVYSNDFDSPAVVGGGATATFSGPGGLQATIGSFAATYGNIWRSQSDSQAVTLSLGNLPAHTELTISFTAAFLDSWDSSNGSPAPDWYEVYIDNNLVGQYTANNGSGSVTSIGGGSLVAQYVQFDANQFFSDSVVDFAGDPVYNFAHSAPTLSFAIKAGGAGWQGDTDEAIGIDNITVTLVPVPEPGTWALLAGGLAVVAGVARRRRG
jgi:PEP-CTERM motif